MATRFVEASVSPADIIAWALFDKRIAACSFEEQRRSGRCRFRVVLASGRSGSFSVSRQHLGDHDIMAIRTLISEAVRTIDRSVAAPMSASPTAAAIALSLA